MKFDTRRWFSRIGASLLALGLVVAPCPSVHAQEEPGGDAESKGRPLDGYFGAGILAFGALYLIGKSARR
ncbi:hypothetical protein [Paludisphaera borealis]|uniref:Uncharacterized protein n=1 Tax=Paludisphaera borealis TaxID=1387353 RepID=A0A1U7CM16_9BACT|nr:hypothetical protein [Paludisphaera borealis]APW59980.1 hypothetical protein BSF38_01441 [Paludisphaera borealis]MDR3621623.1 hypothetical protein [Paludisphaera borealis]